MDENYKEPDLSKVVKQLMDEEGYEFGEAVKEAMAQGYKNGGLMVAIQRFNQGGMAGNKTYHQFHDQYVPMDEESMGYANGGGIGSMMQPKKNKEEPVVQGGVDNYLGKQPQVQAPRKWQSSPNKPATELAYITEAEKDLILKANIHGGLEGGPNMGPSGIISLDSFGDVGGAGASGGDTNAGGGAMSGRGFSGQNTNTTSDRDFDRQKANQRAALQIAERQQAENLGIQERENIANATYGPLQKYTGERGFFGNLLRGANKYGYTDTYTDGPNAGEVKPGYAGRVFGGLLGLLTGIPGIGSIIGNKIDKFKSKPKDMTEFNRLGLFGTPPGTFDFDPNAQINPDVDTTGYSRFSNKSLGIMNPNIMAPPSKPNVIGFNEDIDVGYNDPAFENDLMAKLSTKGMIEYNKLNNKKLQNEATDGLTPAPTPEELDRLNELEIQKNEAALNTTAIV
jgi:hypothetical protein